MIVSSSKGAILPTTMAQLFVENGYRTTNNGTAWSAFTFIADYFGFNEFYTTSNFETMTQYLEQDKNNDGIADYFVVVSCGSGLFTTGGHYIVLTSDKLDTLTVFDPYMYNNKFNTASRKNAKVKVDGNIAYVSESSFKKYANAKNYWIYSNDNGNGNKISLYSAGERIKVNIPVMVAWNEGKRILVDDGAQQFWINSETLKNGNTIQVDGIICYDGGNRDLIEICDVQIWCDELYMSKFENDSASLYSNGTYTTTANLNVRTGPGINYKIKKTYKNGTTINVLETKDNWGRTSNGWVCLDYTKKKV